MTEHRRAPQSTAEVCRQKILVVAQAQGMALFTAHRFKSHKITSLLASTLDLVITGSRGILAFSFSRLENRHYVDSWPLSTAAHPKPLYFA